MNTQSPPVAEASPGGVFAPLFGAGTPSAEAVAAFVAERGFPVAEPGAVTFAWTGEADRVELVRWINGHSERAPFRRVPGTALWVLRLPVRDGGRFEYKLALVRGAEEEWALDPLNPIRAGDPFGENSVCRTLGYAPPDWALPRGAPAGRIEPLAIDSSVFAEPRKERVYLPVGYTAGRAYPLVVVHDGRDFTTYGNLPVVLDNLIVTGDIPPVLALLIQTKDRMGEYPRGRRHARYVVDELLPAAAARFSLSSSPQDRVLLGASLGAVASLATAFRFPGVFRGMVLHSGSFVLDNRLLETRPHPVFHRVAQLMRALKRAPDLPETRAFVSTGELEGLAGENRALADFLRERGVDVLFKCAWDGHHWHNWRNQLRDGLRWVLRGEQGG